MHVAGELRGAAAALDERGERIDPLDHGLAPVGEGVLHHVVVNVLAAIARLVRRGALARRRDRPAVLDPAAFVDGTWGAAGASARKDGDRLVRMYLLTNDKESKLGKTPLPDGMVRVFRHNGREGLSFLVAQQIKYVPIGDKIELNLGADLEVIFELVKLRAWRDNLWMQVQGADVFRRADEPGVQIEVNSTVAGWDDHTLYDQRIRNYTNKPVDVEVRRTFPGHIVFRSGLGAQNHDFQTVQYTAMVKAGQKSDLLYEVLQHQGRNAKQNNVTVEELPMKP